MHGLYILGLGFKQRALTVGGKDHCTAGLPFNKTGFDQKRK